MPTYPMGPRGTAKPWQESAGAYGRRILQTLRSSWEEASRRNLEALEYAGQGLSTLGSLPGEGGAYLARKTGGGAGTEDLFRRMGDIGVTTAMPELRGVGAAAEMAPLIAPILLPGTKLWHVADAPIKKFEPEKPHTSGFGEYTWFGKDLRTAIEPETGAQIYPEDVRWAHKVRVTEPINVLSPAEVLNQRVKGIENLPPNMQRSFLKAISDYSQGSAGRVTSDEYFNYGLLLTEPELAEILKKLGIGGAQTTANYYVPPHPHWNPFYREGSTIDRAVALFPEEAAKKTKIVAKRPLLPKYHEKFVK